MLFGAPLSAQHQETSSIAPVLPRNQIEKRLGETMVCLCGGCGKEPIGTMHVQHRGQAYDGRIATLVDSGKSEDQISRALHRGRTAASNVLGAPIDKGFNRFAWLFPYLLGASGAVVVGFAVVRWSRNHDQTPVDAPAAADPALDDRLDDELRNLD